MEVKTASLSVVRLHLDIVILDVPRHVGVTEIVTPSRESWRPEIHHQVLRLGQELHVGGVLLTAHGLTIEVPLDIGGGPLNHILVPIGAGLVRVDIGLILLLPLPDNVCAEGVVFDGGNQLNIDLVPALLRPVRAVPVKEERADGALFVTTLHTDRESTVSECLICFNLTT